MGFPRREYWGGLPFPPPGALLTQGSNPHLWRLLHWQVDSLPAGHLGSPGEPQALASKLLLREMSTRWQHSPCPSRVSLATGTLEKGTFLGCRSEWTVPGLCLMTSSPPPEPLRQIPDPAKAEAEGAGRWEAHHWETWRPGNLSKLFQRRGSIVLGCPGLGWAVWGPAWIWRSGSLQGQEGLVCCHILPSSLRSTRVQSWDPGLSDFREVTAAQVPEAFLCFSYAFNFYFMLESSWLKKKVVCFGWVYSNLIRSYIYSILLWIVLHRGC